MIAYHRCPHLRRNCLVVFDGTTFASKNGIFPPMLETVFLELRPPICHILLSNDLYDHWQALTLKHKELRTQAARYLGSIGGKIGGAKGGKATSWRKKRSSRKNGKLGGRPRKPRIDCTHLGKGTYEDKGRIACRGCCYYIDEPPPQGVPANDATTTTIRH